ncbi:MAG: hypothetical protein HRF49_09170 [bacterium]
MTNLVLIILVALVKALGGGGLVEKEVAKAVEQALGDKVKGVNVQISADPATFVAKGKIKGIVFILEDFDVDPIVIETTKISIDGLKMNTKDAILGKDAKIKEIGPASWELVIGVNQLTAAVREKAPLIESPYFRTVGNQLEFTGSYRLNKYISVPFKARGRLRAVSGKRVMLDLTHMDVSGLGIPSGIKGMVEKEVNPLLDVDKLMAGKREEIAAYEMTLNRELNPFIDEITIGDGKIVGTGTI